MPAPVVANASSRGNARYDVNGLQWDSARGAYVDDAGWHYDSNGLSLDRPDAYDPSKPSSDSFDESTGQYSFGGGGAGGAGGAGGDLLASPYFQQARAASEAQNAAQESQTREMLRQLLIQTGVIPAGFNDKLGVLDATTRGLIQQNTDTGISQIARLNEGFADQKTSDINQLAARGLGRSGAKGFKLRRASLAFDRNKSDLLSALSGKMNEALGGLAQGQLGRQQSLAQFLASLAQNYRAAGPNVAPTIVGLPKPPSPDELRQGAINYWQSNPAPTYTSPTTGQQWYGGVNGYESTPFKGKALDSLMG
jgi:hypothetical protein